MNSLFLRNLSFVLIIFAMFFLLGCINNLQPSEFKIEQKKASFSCEKNTDNNSVAKRGYVLLMGLGDHNKNGWYTEKKYMEQDPKTQFVLIYDQDETKHLPEISEKFLADMHALLKQKPVDELVIFGASAGGVTASYSIAKLNFSGSVALHTLSSPLNGYGFPDAVLGNRQGYLLDIARGLAHFQKPSDNVKVYHHKTVTDTILVDHYCNGVTFLCNAVQIQNNNIEGSKEFFYSKYDHNPLMKVVIPIVLKCYNKNLVTLFSQEESGIGMGELCTGEDGCRVFCSNNRGLCNQYCETREENQLCRKLFSGELNSDG